MKIIVLNLPRNVKEKEVSILFDPFGRLVSCNLVLDTETGMSKGFGFVEFKEDVSAHAAIAALHGTKVRQNKIRVKIAE